LSRTLACGNLISSLTTTGLIFRVEGVMAELPTGTVTLLFTDIEGSTRLLERLRFGWATPLEEPV
jgi:hypothetical protein